MRNLQRTRHEIEIIYLELLEREPMPAEVEFWRQFFAAGGTSEGLRADLKNTREYQASRPAEAALRLFRKSG